MNNFSDYADRVENAVCELERLCGLLQLYDEFTENEEQGLSPALLPLFLKRQAMGQSLLEVIEDKANALRKTLDETFQQMHQDEREARGLK